MERGAQAQCAVSDGVPDIVVSIDEDAGGKGNPDIFFQPRPGGGGGEGRELYMVLYTHRVLFFLLSKTKRIILGHYSSTATKGQSYDFLIRHMVSFVSSRLRRSPDTQQKTSASAAGARICVEHTIFAG